MNQGFLKLMVLQALSDGSCSGYTLVKNIQSQTGWKPSFGSIYPLLQRLERDGQVKVMKQGRSKLYTLTETGKKMFKEQQATRKDIYNSIIEHLRCLASMGDEEATSMADMLDKAVQSDIPFYKSPELLILRKELYRLMKEGKTNEPNFKIIINNTIKELKNYDEKANRTE